jgi:hypothetical protein
VKGKTVQEEGLPYYPYHHTKATAVSKELKDEILLLAVKGKSLRGIVDHLEEKQRREWLRR